MTRQDAATQRAQLLDQRRKVDFDSYDLTVDELIRRVSRGRIEIAPAYQRQFRWDEERQSRLIESIFLGIPVPPLFMATNIDAGESATWEVVDGLQRLLTLVNFLGDPHEREVARLGPKALKLKGLEILHSLEGQKAVDLPADLRDTLEDRPIRVIVLNDKSDLQVRFDLFERLNTGGIRLTDQEVRESVYMGDFVDLLSELASTPEFRHVVLLPDSKLLDGTPQDFVLRFFAFKDRYRLFEHSVKDFLNDYCRDAAADPQVERRRHEFGRTFSFLADVFPYGLRNRSGRVTPVNLYEGVAVGASLAIEQASDLPVPRDLEWLATDELRSYTTGATNDRARVTRRIEYCRDHFLAK